MPFVVSPPTCRVCHSRGPVEGKVLTEGQEKLAKEIDESLKKFKDVEHLIHGSAKSESLVLLLCSN